MCDVLEVYCLPRGLGTPAKPAAKPAREVYPWVCTHHTLVTDIVALSATGEAAYTKRYTARAALTEPVSQLSVMLALYWWWMKHQATLDLDNGSVSIGSWLTIPSPQHPCASVIMPQGKNLARAPEASELWEWHKPSSFSFQGCCRVLRLTQLTNNT